MVTQDILIRLIIALKIVALVLFLLLALKSPLRNANLSLYTLKPKKPPIIMTPHQICSLQIYIQLSYGSRTFSYQPFSYQTFSYKDFQLPRPSATKTSIYQDFQLPILQTWK